MWSVLLLSGMENHDFLKTRIKGVVNRLGIPYEFLDNYYEELKKYKSPISSGLNGPNQIVLDQTEKLYQNICLVSPDLGEIYNLGRFAQTNSFFLNDLTREFENNINNQRQIINSINLTNIYLDKYTEVESSLIGDFKIELAKISEIYKELNYLAGKSLELKNTNNFKLSIKKYNEEIIKKMAKLLVD